MFKELKSVRSADATVPEVHEKRGFICTFVS